MGYSSKKAEGISIGIVLKESVDFFLNSYRRISNSLQYLSVFPLQVARMEQIK